MQSLPAECPASLLGEPGGVGHTWLRDASCAPPSVLLLSSEQQTVKWEEEVETRDFSSSELPPSNHPRRLWDQGARPTAMRGQWCREGRDGRAQSQQQLCHTCPKRVPVTEHSCWDGHFMLSFSRERLWNAFQTSREPPNWLEVSGCNCATGNAPLAFVCTWRLAVSTDLFGGGSRVRANPQQRWERKQPLGRDLWVCPLLPSQLLTFDVDPGQNILEGSSMQQITNFFLGLRQEERKIK